MKIKKVYLDADGKVIERKLPEDLPRKPRKNSRIIRVSLEKRTRTSRNAQSINGHWDFDEDLNQGKQFGFIYLIRDLVNMRMYIGKKQYYGTGKANKGTETNWKWYTSSCKALQESIKQNGKENFEFYVLEEYFNRGTLGFAETWSLMYVEAPANRDLWYNMLVNKISWAVKENISARHRARLQEITSKPWR